MNDEQTKPEAPAPAQPTEAKPVEAQPDGTAPAEHPSQDARRRLRQLLAIPDRERSDAVWDEIIGLEIQLAPGNRAPSPGEGGNRQEPGRRQEGGRRPDQARRQDAGPGAKQSKRFPKKPKRGPRGPGPGR